MYIAWFDEKPRILSILDVAEHFKKPLSIVRSDTLSVLGASLSFGAMQTGMIRACFGTEKTITTSTMKPDFSVVD